MPITNQVNEDCVQRCKNLEGYRQYPYDDFNGKRLAFGEVPIGKATIGHGYVLSYKEQKLRNLYDVGWTRRQADTMVRQKIQPYADCVRASIHRPVTDNQFTAMVLLCYNIGTSIKKGFPSSSVCRFVNAGDFKSAAESFKNWHMGNGVPHRLDSRRAEEKRIFISSLFDVFHVGEIEPDGEVNNVTC